MPRIDLELAGRLFLGVLGAVGFALFFVFLFLAYDQSMS